MRRRHLSRPLRLALSHQLLAGHTVLDYGCGRGDDVAVLGRLGIPAQGWDPVHRPDTPLQPTEVVHLGYVLNVIEDPVERTTTLQHAWSLTTHCLIVAARLHLERDEAHVAVHADGYLTRRGTFQKFYDQDELRDWLEAITATPAVAAGPGVFYLYRRAPDRNTFLASRFARPVRTFAVATSARRAEQHHDVLGPITACLAHRGRPPLPSELADRDTEQITAAFGSVRGAVRTALLLTPSVDLQRAQDERRLDLLVYLALAAFGGRPRLNDLDDSTRADLKALFPSYRDAATRADQLLYRAGQPDAIDLTTRATTVGKLTPAALYVHTSALDRLPALLRVYEGCARVFIGTVEGANLIKLSRVEPAVSYLSYPDFERDPHPALAESLHVDLRGLQATGLDYRRRENPPVLHRKETFVADDHPRRATFERLTRQEERAGLYAEPARIGTRAGWAAALAAAGVQLRGHRLVRAPTA